jgi:hypothetical protein
MTDCAAACNLIADTTTAAVLHRLLSPYSDLFPTASLGTPSGSVAHYLGLLATTLGSYDDAEAHFTDAAAREERMGARARLARTRTEWARLLLLRRHAGDTDGAHELLAEAITTAQDLGLTTVERRATALLERVGLPAELG